MHIVDHAAVLPAERPTGAVDMQAELLQLGVPAVVGPQLPHDLPRLVIDDVEKIIIVVHKNIFGMETGVPFVVPGIGPQPPHAVAAQRRRAVRISAPAGAELFGNDVLGGPAPLHLSIVIDDDHVFHIEQARLAGFGRVSAEHGVAVGIGVRAGGVISCGLRPTDQVMVLQPGRHLHFFAGGRVRARFFVGAFHRPDDVAVKIHFDHFIVLDAASEGGRLHTGQQFASGQDSGRKSGRVLPDVHQIAVHAVQRHAPMLALFARDDIGQHSPAVPAFFGFVDGGSGGEHRGCGFDARRKAQERQRAPD